jgi:hypothetical protein
LFKLWSRGTEGKNLLPAVWHLDWNITTRGSHVGDDSLQSLKCCVCGRRGHRFVYDLLWTAIRKVVHLLRGHLLYDYFGLPDCEFFLCSQPSQPAKARTAIVKGAQREKYSRATGS